MKSRLARRELDRQLSVSDNVTAQLSRPSGGWIRAVREALGMSQRVLADRLGKSQVTVAGYEERERSGGLKVSTLAEVADAVDCVLVYGFVPKKESFQKTVELRAQQVAAQELRSVSQHMRLEAQGVDGDRMREMIEDRVAAIIESKRLW